MIKIISSRAQVVTAPVAALVLASALLFAWCGPARAGILEDRSDNYKWRLCPPATMVPTAPLYGQASTDTESTEIRADAVRVLKDGLSQFSGDVEVMRAGQALSADIITYDRERDLFTAEGRAHIWDSTMVWAGAEALYDMGNRVSRLRDGDYWVHDGHGRGHARSMRNDMDSKVTVLKGVDYSTCPLSDETWRVSASRIRLDHASERGSARNAVLRVYDMPVFYFPYVSFPISDKRKSGFLSPTFGNTNQSGLDIQLPYYWDIAPNHDATLTPRALTDRGVMMNGQYRYLGDHSDGQLDVEYLPSDRLKDDESRSLLSWRHRQRMFDNRGRVRMIFNNVSDDQYFEDFGGSIAATSQRFLDRRADFFYTGGNYRVRGVVQSYQTIDNTLRPGTGPYRRLPQISFDGRTPGAYMGFVPQIRADTSYFDRDASVTGARINVTPALSYPFVRPYLNITPKIAVMQSEYYLDDPLARFDDRVSRTVPIFSTDSRLFFERRLDLFSGEHIQTFEPRVFYLLVPKVQQDDIPRFDSGNFNASFRNLFRDNRFTGQDRVSDANQIATAVTSRMIDVESGRETYRVSVGQIYYFRDREVELGNEGPLTGGTSELISEVATNVIDDWTARGVLQWDPNTSRTELAAANLRYRPDLDTVLNFGYRFRRAISDIQQADISMRWPVSNNIALVGRWNYSVQEHRSLETLAGVEYESCCWGVRFVGRRFLRNAEGEFDNGFFLQFQFRGLGGIGKKSGSVLNRGIPGYEDPFE
jgi:LPS-assembly protein